MVKVLSDFRIMEITAGLVSEIFGCGNYIEIRKYTENWARENWYLWPK
jgi:hypothetical protein